jgi:hypothetical protein
VARLKNAANGETPLILFYFEIATMMILRFNLRTSLSTTTFISLRFFSSTTNRTIHQRLRPRLQSERSKDSMLVYENIRTYQFRLVSGASAVQSVFWFNVADMWGRNMRDFHGDLAPIWQRASVVGLCALIAAAFSMLAFIVARHHLARLTYFPHQNEIQFATYSILGSLREHPRIPIADVRPVDDPLAIAFRAPRLPSQPLRFFDLSLKIESRGNGKMFLPAEKIRAILRGDNPDRM